MRVLWIDASAGAAGDMLLGALVGAGASLPAVRRALATLPLRDYTLRERRIVRSGLAGRRIEVRVRGRAAARGLADVERILRRGKLAIAVRERATRVFRRLVEAEAEAHGVTIEHAHLHEAGGIDAIIDVVGVCVALDELAVDRIVVSPMTTGYGSVRCAHGVYPVPGPATILLVRGAPVRGGTIELERLTPTGAAILTTLADAWGGLPSMRPQSVGYGAGERDLGEHPNMLRVVLGDADERAAGAGSSLEVVVLECAVDDVTPQNLAYACERMFAAGALDVYTSPVTMKKGRAGHRITALARPSDFEAVSRCMLTETSSLGLRHRTEQRIEIERAVHPVSTPWGTVRVKTGGLDGREIRIAPEYDDCAARALRHGVPLATVQHAAIAAARRGSAAPRRSTRGANARPTRKRR